MEGFVFDVNDLDVGNIMICFNVGEVVDFEDFCFLWEMGK